ncbi:hypothetical protein DFAR_750010 [Desulfarculales bacterium]
MAAADFVTVMMAFFLLMWLTNLASTEKKAKPLAISIISVCSIRAALGSPASARATLSASP